MWRFATFVNRIRRPDMRNLLIAATLLIGAPAFAQQPTSTAQTGPAFKAHVLSRSEFDVLLKHPEKLLIIDVRRPDELSTIGGFPVYLSIQQKELESSLAWIPKDRTIVTVSNHAARAGKAADLLAAKGFKVEGAVGAQLYEKDGGTLLHIPVPAPTTSAK
jgi:rhodanese-related sulfurtransferase